MQSFCIAVFLKCFCIPLVLHLFAGPLGGHFVYLWYISAFFHLFVVVLNLICLFEVVWHLFVAILYHFIAILHLCHCFCICFKSL